MLDSVDDRMDESNLIGNEVWKRESLPCLDSPAVWRTLPGPLALMLIASDQVPRRVWRAGQWSKQQVKPYRLYDSS